MIEREIDVRVNGASVAGRVEPRTSLADFLREQGLTSVHLGCEHGACGACTVLIEGRSVRSCIMLAVQADGHSVLTVEGVEGPGGELHPLQEAFADHHALQCGFCTPGFLLSALELLSDRPSPDEAEVREALSGNLCRCTGYVNIVRAVLASTERASQQ